MPAYGRQVRKCKTLSLYEPYMSYIVYVFVILAYAGILMLRLCAFALGFPFSRKDDSQKRNRKVYKTNNPNSLKVLIGFEYQNNSKFSISVSKSALTSAKT